MYDLIYANGDSYTAGSGLAQEVYYDIGPLDGNAVTEKIRQQTQLKKTKCTSDWSNIERQRAYPATLGFFANTEVLNNAQGGAGLGQIAFSCTKDLIDLSKKHKKILAIIGLTNPQRLFYPRPPNNTLLFKNPLNNYGKIERCILENYAERLTNEELELNGVLSLIAIIQMCDWMPNVDLLLIETPAYHINQVDPNNKYDIISKNIKPKIFDTLVPNYNKEMKIHTGCNHIVKDYHDDLAKRIYNRLWKKRN